MGLGRQCEVEVKCDVTVAIAYVLVQGKVVHIDGRYHMGKGYFFNKQRL